MAVNSIRGFNDLLPHESIKWQKIETEARKFLSAYGFSEIRTPLLERTELFSRSIGEATDIVEKEMYSFDDRKGASLTLRPEGTAPVVRAYIEHKLYQNSPVTKLYYMGPMFRYERPQKGRSRQFYQIGAEVFGITDPSIDAEIMDMLMSFFSKLSLTDLELQVNSLGCDICRPTYMEALNTYLSDTKSLLCDDCQRRVSTNPLRVLDCKKNSCKDATFNAPVIEGLLCNICTEHFDGVKESLHLLNVPFIVNPRMVRGLDYYTRTTFEIVCSKLGAQNAVVAGGRYDKLVKDLGGPDMPAFGFALGMERLASLVDDAALRIDKQLPCYLIPLGENAKKEAVKLTKMLRGKNIRIEMSFGNKGLKWHLKKIDKLSARFVLILGDDEIEKSEVTFRDMEKGIQKNISMDNIFSELESCLKKAREGVEAVCS